MSSNLVTIAGRTVGPGAPTFIVAEMAWSHEGSRKRAEQIVGVASRAGADAINFHITSLPDYMVRDYGSQPGDSEAHRAAFDYLASISLGQDDWRALAALAAERGLVVSAMCNDLPSLEFAVAELSPGLVMIHPSCAGDEVFVEEVAARGLPVVVYVGGLLLGEIQAMLDRIAAADNHQVLLLDGFQSFPTPIGANQIRRLRSLQQMFGIPVGFADHTDGADPYALTLPCVAVAAGASFLEKHLTDGRARQGVDYEAALGPVEFGEFVRQVHNTDEALGDGRWGALTELQRNYRSTVRKRAVAAKSLAAGDTLVREAVVYKRSPAGLLPEELGLVLGRVLARAINSDEPITGELFKL